MNSKKCDSYLGVRPDLWIYLFLVIIIIAVYHQVGTFDFVNYDTHKYVYHNRYVKSGLTVKNFNWAFTTTYFSNWHPLTWLSHMLDVQLFGLNSGRHHLTNVLLHIANTILLFAFLRRMTGCLGQSGFVAALFALHPLHVESVAWVAERKDLLSTFFGFLVFWFYARYVEHPGRGRYLPLLLFFILGLMAKPMLVTLPFVLLLLDYWPLRRLQFQISKQGVNAAKRTYSIFLLIAEKIPLMLCSAASCLVTLYAQMAGGAVGSVDQYPLHIRISNALISYMSYIAKMIWPVNLAVFYPYHRELPLWQIGAACLFIIGISWLSIRWFKSRPWLLVGWLWYLGTLVPVIGLVQVGMQSMADRYTYIPLIGVYLIAAWSLFDLLVRWRHWKVAYAAILIAIVCVLMVVSWRQVGYWRNSVTLFKRTVDVTEENFMAHNNIGQGMLLMGDTGGAIRHFKKSLEINPRSALAHFNLGIALSEQGRLKDALQSCLEAVRVKPDFAEAYNCQGNAQAQLGKPDQAILSYRQAIRINSEYVEAYNNLGKAYYWLGKPDKALPGYLQAIRIDPLHAIAYNNAGAALIQMGQIHKAVAFFKEAIRINPDYIEAQNNLKRTLTFMQTNIKNQ